MVEKVTVYIVTVVASLFFYGQMGAFSIVKEPLGKEFSFSSTYLGKF